MKKLMIRIVVMLTCLFVCHIQASKAVADKFFQNRTKRLYRNNKGDNTPSDKHNQNLANLAAKYRFESFMRISRKLTPKEMKQIAKQNHRINGKNKIINLSLNQIRIIDFNSILNGLEGDLGKNIIDNYRSFVKKGNEQSWIDELRKFPNKNGKIIIENNNANPIKLDSNQCINQLLENLNSSQIKHNKTFRQNLMIFMLVNKLRSIIDKNHKTKLVNNNNGKNFFLEKNRESKIYLSFPYVNHDFFTISKNFNQNINVKLNPFSKKFPVMHHECGHFWYTFLRGYPGLIKPKVLKPINSDLHFLFPHCNMFEPNDISKWLKILNNNVDSLRNCLFDIYTKILKNNWLSELDNAFKGLKSQKTKTRSNSLKNVADLLNKMTDVKIFGNDDEVAQILGLEIIKNPKSRNKNENIIFVNRLSDFDCDVYNKNPFRVTYITPSNIKEIEVLIGEINNIKTNDQPDNIKYQSINTFIKKNMKENKLINAIEPSILLSVLSRTHEFFNKKIKPSRNDLEMLFALHGKNLNEYQK